MGVQLHRIFVLCVFVMFTCWTFSQESPFAGVHATYSLRNKELAVGQPVILTFTLVNHSGGQVRVDLGQDRKGSFAFTIIKPDQQQVALPAFSRDGISQFGLVQVDAGQTFSEDLILDEWYQFRAPGQYRLRIILKEPIRDADGRLVFEDHGFELPLTIGVRNRPQLERLCATLVDKISQASSYSDAAEYAMQLSHVSDPVAVPYLKRALELGKSVEPLLIAGLEKIGDDSAVQALIWSLKFGSPDTKLLARSALQQVYGTTDSSSLRKQIEQVLATDGTKEK